MPSISKIRLTNVVYENGGKRFNDDIFLFDGYNGAILLENGGGKTVLVQTVLQAILPHHDLEERKIKDTLLLEGNPCHIAIEWILNDSPRTYLLTAVTLYLHNNKLDSYRYTYEYDYEDKHNIETIPFVQDTIDGGKRPADKGEISDYHQQMQKRSMNAKTFKTIKEYHDYLEQNYKIIPQEWRSIARINSAEGGVEGYFENCKTTTQLVDRLLIPVVEDAISTGGSKSFVKTFEEQRERFKEHRRLKDKIEESKKIQLKIEDYVQVYKGYDDVVASLNAEKQHTKALFQYLEKEKEDIGKDIEAAIKEAEELEELYKEVQRKEKSYDLAKFEQGLDHAQQKLEQQQKEFSKVNDEYQKVENEIENLEIADLKGKIKLQQEVIKDTSQQLKQLEAKVDIKEIRTSLEENGKKLKGYYVNVEKRLDQDIVEINRQQKLMENRHKNEEEVWENLNEQNQQLLKEINEKRGQLSTTKKDIQEKRSNLHNLSPKEDINSKLYQWNNKVGELEEKNVKHSNNIKNLQHEKSQLDLDLSKQRKEKENLNTQIATLQQKLDDIAKEQKALMDQIVQYNDGWHNIDSIYTKESSICNFFEDKVERLLNEKEDALLKERVVGRSKDDYGHSKHFTPQPKLEQWVDSWKREFDYIETGVTYIQRAAKASGQQESQLLEDYPYWPVSIVVEDKEMDILQEKLKIIADKITYPVIVLGQKEAFSLIKGEKSNNELIFLPKLWQENVNQQKFENWKHQIENELQLTTNKRKEKEQQISNCSAILMNLRKFFDSYSYDYYKELQTKLVQFKESIAKTKEQIENSESRLQQIDLEVKNLTDIISSNKDEINVLNNWVKLAMEIIAKEKEIKAIKSAVEQKELAQKEIVAKLAVTKKSIKQLEENIWDKKEKGKDLHRRKLELTKDRYYDEVQPLYPILGDFSKEALVKQRESLYDQLHDRQGEIKHYQDKINEATKMLKGHQNGLKRKRDKCRYPIDEEVVFEVYGEEHLDALYQKEKELNPILEFENKKLTILQKEYEKLQSQYDVYERQFYELYSKKVTFTMPLSEVKESIDREKTELHTSKQDNKEEIDKLKAQNRQLEKLIRDMEIENGKFQFLGKTVSTVELEEGTLRNLPYKREEIINTCLEKLRDLQQTLTAAQEQLTRKKQSFLRFCAEEINDPKRRKLTEAGVSQKDSFPLVLDWQTKMEKSISNSIRIWEDDIREHDKDLKQFIEYLATYLQTLTEELKVIPKKTRIKIGDKWKEVFQFVIPQWTIQEGKEAVRKHINWMIDQLDSDRYKEDDGSDNHTLIRKDIEKWLDAKQLLSVILKDEKIKVNCRKVTNDNAISSRLSSWQSSNQWSGGEKWSKNMTLFLGVLNYLAEKRQGLITKNKANRTVIVDNPFGKASSDHVLDPVFFIAEKLGFQVIALTAHSEGSFIRNYFPIVYSLRLREAESNDKLIIDKEKEIHHAFFQDKDPDALNRLEEKKQISLFDQLID
ncbi:hypothetical protein PRVXT_000404 [Proteinivorax tanatarense]|uniref:Chromosome segregation ATPase n=1 Tax=Proteinivorax tanatarense TaxID=1260629 RepID=A0AAU7VMK4_9FIRM